MSDKIAYNVPVDDAIVLGRAILVLERAIETDERYWETMETGQDMEEAEESASLNGYLAGLQAVQSLLAGNREPLDRLCVDLNETLARQQEEIEQCENSKHLPTALQPSEIPSDSVREQFHH